MGRKWDGNPTVKLELPNPVLPIPRWMITTTCSRNGRSTILLSQLLPIPVVGTASPIHVQSVRAAPPILIPVEGTAPLVPVPPSFPQTSQWHAHTHTCMDHTITEIIINL